MTRPVTVQIGSESHQDPSPDGFRSRVLTLIGAQAAQRLDGVFAIVSGRASDVDRAHRTLEKSFRPSSRTNLLPAGMEEDYLASLLAGLGSETTSIAIAVWVDWDLVVACCGGSRVYFSHRDVFTNLSTVAPQSPGDHPVRVLRFTPAAADSIALVACSSFQTLDSVPTQTTLKTYFSQTFMPHDVAQWLVAHCSQAGQSASALVVQFSALKPMSGHWQTPAPVPVERGYRGLMGAALAGLLIAAAFFGFSATRGSPTSRVLGVRVSNKSHPIGQGHRIANHSSLPAPRVQTASSALQSWKFPALTNAPRGRVLVALYNPTRNPVATKIRIITRTGVVARTVHVSGLSSLKIPLAANEVRDQRQNVVTLYVQGHSPIIPLRIVVGESSAAAST